MRLCSDCKEKERSWSFQQSICDCTETWCENYKEVITIKVPKKTFRRQKEILNYFKVVKILNVKTV